MHNYKTDLIAFLFLIVLLCFLKSSKSYWSYINPHLTKHFHQTCFYGSYLKNTGLVDNLFIYLFLGDFLPWQALTEKEHKPKQWLQFNSSTRLCLLVELGAWANCAMRHNYKWWGEKTLCGSSTVFDKTAPGSQGWAGPLCLRQCWHNHLTGEKAKNRVGSVPQKFSSGLHSPGSEYYHSALWCQHSIPLDNRICIFYTCTS